jgi:hypothetical protein
VINKVVNRFWPIVERRHGWNDINAHFCCTMQQPTMPDVQRSFSGNQDEPFAFFAIGYVINLFGRE